jgi:hypothetical protein
MATATTKTTPPFSGIDTVTPYQGNALIEVGDDPGDRPPKRACHSRHDKCLSFRPIQIRLFAVLPLENLSGDPDLAEKCLRPEIFLSGVSYQNTTDQQGEQS